ncbi:sigma-70 family RNA polymerase sigma factor [Parafrankia sp. FMc2]|uniref:sigma-70 family RNA polymerase sigma factor n=1 Tax=Parafrankia sp. FMc2 TaxID=3233196 RepID=UPI0034D42BF2
MDSRPDPPEPVSAPRIAPARASGPSADTVAAFSGFYRRFVPTLVGFLIWQGVRQADAVEIAQDTMAAAFQSWRTIDHPEAWTRRVASRAYARRIAALAEDPVAEVPEARSPLLGNPGDLAAVIGRHEVLRLLELLPPRQRQVMAWTVDGFAPSEIAQELKMEPEAVRSSLYKARRTLAGHVDPSKGGESRA